MVAWKELYTNSARNTGIAAAAAETISDSLQNLDRHAPFNFLLVENNDAVDIEIYLDGIEDSGRAFIIPVGSLLKLGPDDGIKFSFIKQKNIDAAAAETANKILFRWSRNERA